MQFSEKDLQAGRKYLSSADITSNSWNINQAWLVYILRPFDRAISQAVS